MKKRIVALLLCCVMLLTLSPSLIATATADDETVQQVEQTGETKDTDPQPDQQPDQAKDGDKNEPQPTEEPKQDTAPVEEDGADADEPAPAPAVVPVVEQNVPVTSEIVSPPVNFTDVAPFLDPVSGSSMRRAARNVATQADKDDGISMSKTATANKDGSYTITLETYATGEKTISEITKDVPTDIILVLDQSGSMADAMGSVSFTEYEDENDWWYGTTYHTRNQDYYEYRHNGGSSNLWHKLSDGSYVSVSVAKQEQVTYTPLGNLVNYDTSWGSLTTDCYYYYADRLYAKVNGKHLKVTVTRSGGNGLGGGSNRTYTYTVDGKTIATSRGNSSKPTFAGIDGGVLYAGSIDNAKTVYTYTYTDAAGNAQTIGTSTGDSTVFKPTLYKRSVSTSGGGTRLAAIKNAATTFVNAVNAKAKGADGVYGTDDDVNHRIAVVGFASRSGYGNNTELLSISGTNSGSVGVAYNSISNQNLKDVVQNMNTAAGKTKVDNAINALAAEGATRLDLGMDMAERILNANPVPAGEKRNRVVIVFTDGSPTDSNGFELDVANAAINKANAIKNSGATVYSIGIFSGADASSAGTKPNNDLGSTSNKLTAACNWFMQKVSSNNGTPRTPSYYLSAGDSASLNNIFQQISDQISTGGSDSQLTESAVVRDIISPQFTLPAGASAKDITLETYACTDVDANGAYIWSKNTDAMGATATVSGDQVDVTGFNYSENWCGSVTEKGSTTYRGNKLVIKFTVQPKDGFLGGNDVITNGEKSGIYVNDQASNPLKPFERPQVNVPIKDVSVTAQDKNVYLLGSVTADDLKSGAIVKVGNVPLDLSKATDTNKPYGLEAWQTEYVDITVTVKDAAGNAIPAAGLTGLTDDTTTYTITVTVEPKTNGADSEGTKAETKTGSGEGKINVFKPVLTFKDSTAYYGGDAPAYTNNVDGEVWKHGDTLSTNVTMIGEKPELAIDYTPEAGKIVAGKINTKQDIAVDVTVKIGSADVTDKTTFVHQDCNPVCGWNVTTPNGNPAFLIHVKTCQLTITKTGGAENEPYVFTVKKDGNPYTEVTIVGNNNVTIYELPVGTYTIEENTKWSWRYPSPTYSTTTGVALSADSHEGTITCTNTLDNNKWLNGFSDVVTNTFGVAHN